MLIKCDGSVDTPGDAVYIVANKNDKVDDLMRSLSSQISSDRTSRLGGSVIKFSPLQ